MASQKTHFPPNITPYQIGWHIVAINLSDLAAKGAKPLGILVAAGMPEDYRVKFLEDMLKEEDEFDEKEEYLKGRYCGYNRIFRPCRDGILYPEI